MTATTAPPRTILFVGEATQQALLGEDFSITNAALVIATLIGLERLSDYLWWRVPAFNGPRRASR